MRHGKKFNHLSRTADHRRALLANMAISLIMHKRITTTLAKAKALKKYVEPLLTRAKDENNKTKEQSTTQHRVVFSYLQNKEALKELFNVVGPKIGDRPGGYTRIIKLGHRLGDGADIAFIELVDFNEHMLKEPKAAKKTRRSRRSGAKDETAETAPAEKETAMVEEAPVVEEAPAVEEAVVEDAPATEDAPAEETKAE